MSAVRSVWPPSEELAGEPSSSNGAQPQPAVSSSRGSAGAPAQASAARRRRCCPPCAPRRPELRWIEVRRLLAASVLAAVLPAACALAAVDFRHFFAVPSILGILVAMLTAIAVFISSHRLLGLVVLEAASLGSVWAVYLAVAAHRLRGSGTSARGVAWAIVLGVSAMAWFVVAFFARLTRVRIVGTLAIEQQAGSELL
ncbi:hypothetical protein T492DRAFT_1030731 [Pavlovales sp. CCMP2436]|nr:hypothetical protein T492DRAFT_1030731 [Pavlovales sp. CCMP2436]|mmetsp:Transcript_5012/g.12983  ORF Transcript_5012/g.12983 Transcript_5012/m.12983 type:complete len:199 (-) Transcript_5012:135-731(-)